MMVEEREYYNNEEQLVVFKLAREEYGVSILNVQEIKRITEITRVPYTPEFIKGVMNLRGSVLPVIDTKKRLGIENEEYTEDTRIIILKVDEVSIGMIVDAVSEVIAIPQDKIEPPESVVARYEHSFISGVGNLENRLIILLDLVEMIGIGTEAK